MKHNIVIVMSRCSQTKAGFGIRLERQQGNLWSATWAFAIKEGIAKKEGYDQSRIDGTFMFDHLYPGCPHCHASSIVKCDACNAIACWDGVIRVVTCPTCGSIEEIIGTLDSLDAGRDR